MTNSNPLISVVIPAYNYAATLSRAVDSVMAQLSEQIELLVIDDGSTDATPEVLHKLHEQHPGGFRSIRQDNAGLAAVRNKGIDEAKGDYLVFLDADDEMVDGALVKLQAHIEQYPGTRLVIAGHYSVREDGRVSLHRPQSFPSSELARVKAYLLDKTLTVSNGACAMHREVFAPGRYPESFRNAEDIPVFAQVFARYPCSSLDNPMARIYKHGDSLRHNLTYDLQIGERLVDEVFGRLPESVQCLRQAFTAQRYLSLFRNFLLAGQKAQAKHFYRQALRADWRAVLRWSYTRKAVKLWLS